MELKDIRAASDYKDTLIKENKMFYGRAAGLIFANHNEDYEYEFSYSMFQNCHSNIRSDITGRVKYTPLALSVIMDQGLLGSSLRRGAVSNYLRYLMLDSPFRMALSSARDLASNTIILDCGVIPVDLDKTPANVAMGALIAIRAIWEAGKWADNFSRLYYVGLNPNLAFLLAPYVEECRGGFTYNPVIGNINHFVFNPSHIGLDYVNNYLNGRFTHVAPDTLSAGCDYMDGGRYNNGAVNKTPDYNVYSLFSETSAWPSDAMSNRDGEWMRVIKELFNKETLGMDTFISRLGNLNLDIPNVLR